MTYRELYLTCKRDLAAAGVDLPGNDAAVLLRHFFRLDRPGLALHGDESPSPEEEAAFLRAAAERAARRPLQYILGTWEFLGLSLKVGEGVLVPREDTAVLVEALAEHLRDLPAPRGADLCAGTGAVALGLCSLVPGAEAVCIELSGQAFPFLEENLNAYPQYRTRSVRGDVLLPETAGLFPEAGLDFIASNPPYIAAEELPGLQAEVQKEPALALDGGRDGLLFYRAIAQHWLRVLKPGGVLAVEIGDTQAEDVCALFAAHGLERLCVYKDWAGLDRAVLARRPFAEAAPEG